MSELTLTPVVVGEAPLSQSFEITGLQLILSHVQGQIRAQNQDANNFPFASKREADSVHRFAIREDGKLEWGAGGASNRDTDLYRESAAQLRTGGSLLADDYVQSRSLQTGAIRLTDVNGDGTGAPIIFFGSAFDTNLYRAGPSTLKTDDEFHVAGDIYGGLTSENLAIVAGDTGTTTLRLMTYQAGALSVRIQITGAAIGFYGATPVAKQSGVAVSAAGIHAALVNLGLIAA